MAAGPPGDLPCATDHQETMPFDVSVAAVPEPSAKEPKSDEKNADEKRKIYQNGKKPNDEKKDPDPEDKTEFSESQNEARFYKNVTCRIMSDL